MTDVTTRLPAAVAPDPKPLLLRRHRCLVPGFGGFDANQFPVPQVNPSVQPAGYAFSIWGLGLFVADCRLRSTGFGNTATDP